MGYCSPKKHKDIQVYTKVHNNTVPAFAKKGSAQVEVREPKTKIKQDYESVKNQVMESNSKVVDIPSTKTQIKKQ